MTTELVEAMARAACIADGYDPEQLEPGDDPYMNGTPVDDGRNRKGEICHFYWRRYVDRVEPLLPFLDQAHRAGELAMRERVEEAANALVRQWEEAAANALHGPKPNPTKYAVAAHTARQFAAQATAISALEPEGMGDD